MKLALRVPLLVASTVVALTGCSKQQPSAPAANGAVDSTALAQPAAKDIDAQRSAFLAAAEPFEVLTEQAPTATSEKLKSLIGDAQGAADSVAATLGAPQKAALDIQLSNFAAGVKRDDRTAIALAAVEGYRTLVESAGDTGVMPRAVSLLDYAGFRYQADLTANPIRWSDAKDAVSFAEKQWSMLGGKVTDSNLKGDFGQAVAEMRAAISAKDAGAAKRAVTKELDLVDKLEGFFSKKT